MTTPNIIKVTAAVENGPVNMDTMIDNVQLGTRSITADFAKGQTQDVTFSGTFLTSIPHEVGCKHDVAGSILHVLAVSIDGIPGVSPITTAMQKIDWRKFKVPARTVAAPPPVVVPPAVHIRDAGIGGYAGFSSLNEADLTGLRATKRGVLYIHMSAATPGDAAKIKALLTLLVPEESDDGHEVILELGTNTALKKGDAYDSFIGIPGLVCKSAILNCWSSGDLATSVANLNSTKSWIAGNFFSRFPGATIAPVVTPGGNDSFLGTSFETNAHWINQNALEAYGGRACEDVPTANRNQTKWLNHNIEHGRSAMKRGLPYDLILSPQGESDFTGGVKAVCAAYWNAGVFPTRIICENYTPGSGVQIGLETADTLNRAALWVAQNKPAVSA